MKFLNEKSALLALSLLAIAVLITPLFIRGFSIYGNDSYFHARIVKQLSQAKTISYDSLMQRGIVPEPYFVFLFFGSKLLDPEKEIIILPLVFTLACIFLFYQILKKIKLPLEERFLAAVLLILSPAMIYTANVSNEFIMGIFFLVLGIYLLMLEMKSSAIFLLAVSLFFGWVNALFTLAAIVVYAKKFAQNKKTSYAVFLVFLAAAIIYYACIFSYFGIQYTNASYNLLSTIITELSAEIGLSLFMLAFAFIGMILSWEKIGKFFAIPIVMLVLAAPRFSFINIYTGFICAYFASYCFFYFFRKEWLVKLVKNLTLTVFLCGIIFSTVFYIQKPVHALPQEELDGFAWMKKNIDDNSIILSSPEKGFLIEYHTEKPVFIDQYISTKSSYSEKINITESIFASQNIKKTSELLSKYRIKYIFLTNEMKKEIWNNQHKGLLFLFRNTKIFKSIYSNKDVEVWEVIPNENDKF